MAQTKNQRQAASLKRALKDQGRTVAWLAERTEYSRPYVSNILHGRSPFTEEFQAKALEALEANASVPVTYRGRTIHVPEDIYRKANTLPLIVVESVYEEAWKKAWLQEHGASVLAIAAERAFQLETLRTETPDAA